ncbi:hypothetical protein [Geminicoccus flavidas]|uniref:hypothetical protein n=1 Tax=Geminicoccus flavidas TaxID=2506407 RepID=UPI00135A2E95|nr:hypothetical protein [Geminicoccus flavidas]
MSIGASRERSLLSQSELERVRFSHYPGLVGAERDELVELARWLREQRGRLQGQIRQGHRLRRGKAEPRSQREGSANEQQLAARKQVFSQALRRVNSRLGQFAVERRRQQNLARLQAALERKRNAPVHHPQPGPHAAADAASIENPKDTVQTDPREIGRVSQFVKDAQARRDDQG